MFFTKRIDSHNESNRFESRIGMLYHKTARTSGTRCVQHKLKAANILLKQYGLIVLALMHITGDAKMKKLRVMSSK